MATIINNQNLTTNLVDGKIESSAVANPNDVRIQTEISNASDEDMYLFQSYIVNDGTKDVELLDKDDMPVKHKIVGNKAVSVNLISVNSASLKVVLTPVGTHDGDATTTTHES